MSRIATDESGQVTAFFVAILALILGFVALSVDVGFFMHTRRVAQNAADAGALAGAAALAHCPLENWASQNGETPATLAAKYRDRNLRSKTFSGTDDTPFPVVGPSSVNAAVNSVYVKVTRPQSFLFGQVLNLVAPVKVPGDAEAVCGSITEYLGICPFYLEAPTVGGKPGTPANNFNLDSSKLYQFKTNTDNPGGGGGRGGGRGGGGPGGGGGNDPNHGYLGLYGKNANDIGDSIAAGCKGTLDDSCSDGEVVETGATPTCTQTGIVESTFGDVGEQFYYEGRTVDGVTYKTTAYCDILPNMSTVDISGPVPTFNPTTTPSDAKFEDCSEDPDPTDNVSGRIWPVALIQPISGCTGWCDVEFIYVALMYVGCSPYAPNDTHCDGQNGTGAIYGMFRDFYSLADIPGGGIGNDPHAPWRVVLVR